MTEPLQIPQITIIAITDRDHGKTIEAIHKTLEHIRPARTILFSDVFIESPKFECIMITPLRCSQKYNEFVTWELGKYPIDTSHILLVQYDGHVLDASAWTDEFLQYDYIGAPWTYTDGRNVGNGGFSLRSMHLHRVLCTDKFITVGSPEDEIICRLFRGYLEIHHKIKYAPEELASKFSFEMRPPKQKTFGFHNYFHAPWREPIILKRNHAMGDVIMLEPVMEYFNKAGYRVILDCIQSYHNLFRNHFYKVEHLVDVSRNEDTSSFRVINFDMAYEVTPKQLALKSYFEIAGIKDYKLRNSKLNFKPTPETRMFDKYAIIHISETDMPYRNIHGVDWDAVAGRLMLRGYDVFYLKGSAWRGGIKINTFNENMLAYIIAGADLFIGSDSGCAHIAVACGVKSMIFFGSVNPAFRYHDLSNITVIQEPCQYSGCYHETIGSRGTACRISEDQPPCAKYSTKSVIETLNEIL